MAGDGGGATGEAGAPLHGRAGEGGGAERGVQQEDVDEGGGNPSAEQGAH